MKIKRYLNGRENSKPNIPFADTPLIVMHETGNPKAGADALAHAKWQRGANGPPYSWHATADDGDTIYQSLEWSERGWHAGTGTNGRGNIDGIGIEICVNEDGDLRKAWTNGIWLARYLIRNRYARPEIIQHNDCSGKHCPMRMRDGTAGLLWGDVQRLILQPQRDQNFLQRAFHRNEFAPRKSDLIIANVERIEREVAEIKQKLKE